MSGLMGELSMAKPGERKSRECLTQSMDVLGLKVARALLEQKERRKSKERMKLFNDVKYKVLCLVVRSSGTQHK